MTALCGHLYKVRSIISAFSSSGDVEAKADIATAFSLASLTRCCPLSFSAIILDSQTMEVRCSGANDQSGVGK